jgi:hypothetical protein
LNTHTRLLEACQWDELRAAKLSEILSLSLAEMQDMKIGSKKDITDKLSSILSEKINKDEIVILVEIVEDMFDNFIKSLSSIDKYEN